MAVLAAKADRLPSVLEISRLGCENRIGFGKLRAPAQAWRDAAAMRKTPAMDWSQLRRALEPALRRVFHLYWRFARGMTLGVRGVVLDDTGRVFLIRHTYVAGWHLPGGGVEVGESFAEALRRELVEEGRIEVLGEAVLHGLFLNSHVSPRDHVAVYVVRSYRQDRLPAPNREIAETGFFARDALPPDTTLGTRLRIAEVLDGVAPIATWRGSADDGLM
jgi:ADP-ribose pyrophosphatase YjhB (NUDIX family)